MKQTFKLFSLLVIGAVAFTSCKKDDSMAGGEEISSATLSKISSHGFGTSNVQKVEDGYLVEGDIILTENYLNSVPGGNHLRIAENEQYRTTNLVNGPRTIRIGLDSKLAALPGYPEALQMVASRYDAAGIVLNFDYVTSAPYDIIFVSAGGNFLASAGFPSGGSPYGQVKVNTRYIGSGTSSTFVNFLATILAHEAGHCIGFRHTDYMNRAYSCGGAATNEGASSVGAILIPGTPSGPDAGSWMLACIGQNQNRPFNNNDRTALSYLY